MSSQSESTFASIVRIPSYMQPWPRLDGDNPLALLHAKFWNKSMAVEEQQWLQAAVNETAVVDETMDEVTTMDPDDDIISGCYMLNIDIDGLEPSKLWIRAEYIRVFNFANARYDKLTKVVGRAPCVVVTGQPGIGKSEWVYYVLRRCLAERRPVIWYYQQCCYLFVEEGVYKMPAHFQEAQLKRFIWTLVDSDEADGVPGYLVTHGTPLFVIFSTTPCRDRWSRLHKTVRMAKVIMNPWKRKEILRAASIYTPYGVDEFRTNEIFDRLGPIPRLCIEYQLNPIAMSLYEQDLDTAISLITSDKLESLVISAPSADLGTDFVSHTIVLLKRESLDDVHSQGVVIPITPYIQSRLSNRFRNLERKELLRLYNTFTEMSGRMAGVFQEESTLELVPMIKLDEA